MDGRHDAGGARFAFMKILWVKSDFLHPTNRGGQIRTLEMLRSLHRKHEIHYVAFETPGQPEGLARSNEYCTKAYPIAHQVPRKTSPAFALPLLRGLVSPVPVAIALYRSQAMQAEIERLLAREKFDAQVVDFITPGVNIGDPSRWILFQHNVETMIWKRHAEYGNPLRKWYFGQQADRMAAYEAELCRKVRKVIAVSETDARQLESMFKLPPVDWVSTGVDVGTFTPKEPSKPTSDLVFVGSMDWLANIDGVNWFLDEILPLIRRKRPKCTVAIVGRNPAASVRERADKDRLVTLTGTVPDVRPYLWNGRLSIVPLRIGSGTRLKIFEAMAAKAPVISTTVGAEGLPLTHGEDVLLADTPADFAARCVEMLEDERAAERMAAKAWDLVDQRFSWESVTAGFEKLLAR